MDQQLLDGKSIEVEAVGKVVALSPIRESARAQSDTQDQVAGTEGKCPIDEASAQSYHGYECG